VNSDCFYQEGRDGRVRTDDADVGVRGEHVQEGRELRIANFHVLKKNKFHTYFYKMTWFSTVTNKLLLMKQIMNHNLKIPTIHNQFKSCLLSNPL